MDSLYHNNAPKPFNRYPPGYRPISSHGSSSNLRSFGSMSHIPPSPEYSPSSYQTPYSAGYGPVSTGGGLYNANSLNSFADLNGNYSSAPSANAFGQSIRSSFRAGSVGPYAYGGTMESPASPTRVAFSPPYEPPPQRQEYVQHNENQQQQRFKPDDFLEKLRRQKEEIERSFGQKNYDQPERAAPLPPAQPSFQVGHPDSDSSPSTGGWRNPSHVHRTRSESHIFGDQLYPAPAYLNNSQQRDYRGPDVMSRSFIEPPATRSPVEVYSGGLLDQALDRVPKSGFFRNRNEPNWMTHPPPPMDIQPRLNNGFNSYDQQTNTKRNSGLYNPSDIDNRVIPIKLDDDRILKIYTQQPPLEPSPSSPAHHYRPSPFTNQPRSVNIPISVETSYPHVNQFHSMGDSRYQQSRAVSPPQHRPAYEPPRRESPPRDFWSQPTHVSAPVSVPVASSAPPPPPPPPPSASPLRIQRTQSVSEPSNVQRPNFNRERSKTPTGVEVPTAFHDELMSVIPNRTRRTPFSNQRRSQILNEDADLFSPIASKVYPGTSRINGFIHEPQPVPTAGTFQQFRQPHQKERSFAVVSRPQTPPASLEHPLSSYEQQSPSSPINPLRRPREFSPPSSYDSGFQQPNRRDFSPPSRLPPNTGTTGRSFSPLRTFSPTTSISTIRSNMSPMSAYDNDSETELTKFPTRNGNQLVNNRREAPQGILVKGNGPRPAKKVVFQCDADIMNRLRHDYMSPSSADVPAHVRAYDAGVEDAISRFASLSDQIGGDVAVMKVKTLSVFDALRNFLWTAAGRTEPGNDEVQKLVQPIVQIMGEIGQFKDSKRNTPLFNHLSAVAEGIPAVGWVLVKKTPAPYVKEMLDASMFYINRILKEHKDGDQKHIEWVKTWKEILEEMQKFVRQTHTTGLVWNSAPGSAPSGTSASSGGPPAPPAGGAPPPPPPPPPADLMADLRVTAPSSSDGDKAGRDALFASLNKGESVTSGLRKVTSDMQTHKNPTLRGQGPAAPTGAPSARSGPAPVAAVQHPPKIELKDGKNWDIEYQKNNQNIQIEVHDKKQTMYVYKCENSVIQVKGKLNSITLDGCKKVSIVFDALVAQCETINCQSIQIQTLGEMPTLSIQKTDGCQVYLSQAAIGTEIVTSKSSEMNILVPTADGDFSEFPVPEQFKTVISGGKLVTSASDII